MELTYNGEVYVLVDSTPIRLMTGFKGNVCKMCQLEASCGTSAGHPTAQHCCFSGPLVFVKKLEV